ncbi:MAG: hypothetical protein IK113_03155 [Bacteroidales bacterium]|nr:hypothetical protein [Bacteroidales bacterium]
MKKLLSLVTLVLSVLFYSCNKQNSGENDAVKTITIDGEFSDWDTLDQTKIVTAKHNNNSGWEGLVRKIRVYANSQYVFYLIEFNDHLLKTFLKDGDTLPTRINLNTDGEFTSGYKKYFLDSYDFMFEGELADGMGSFTNFDVKLYQNIGGSWTKPELGTGVLNAVGKDEKIEISLDIAKFNELAAKSSVPMLMGDTFQTGMTFYDSDWSPVCVLPNAQASETEDHGLEHLLNVTVDK